MYNLPLNVSVCIDLLLWLILCFYFWRFLMILHNVIGKFFQLKTVYNRDINVTLLKIQNKKHAKVQKFMQIGCKILSLPPLIL